MKLTKRKRLRLMLALRLAINSEESFSDTYWVFREPNDRDYIMKGYVSLVRKTEANIKAFEKLLKEFRDGR